MTKTDNKKPIRGTREWAVAEINCCLGCSHGCRYCYARYDLVVRRGMVTPEQWSSCRVIEKEVVKKQPLYPGQVMFPTAHDIVPENLEDCLVVLRNLLDAGNRVLVVTKPHLDCVRRICSDFSGAKDRILFRFTITARDLEVLQFWEPHAPDYLERKCCLEYAFNNGFDTSVSVEPMLDTADVAAMVRELLPCVSHSIWLGKMNKITERVACDSEEMRLETERIERGQSNERLFQLFEELGGLKQVRWKESVKEVLGLQQATEPGLDL